MRTRAERRKNDYKHIAKKEHIIKDVFGMGAFEGMTHGGQIHRLSKKKVHCSCPLCSAKTSKYGNTPNFTHADRIKIDSMNNQLKEM